MNPGLVVKLRPSGPWRIGPDSGARNRVDVIYHSDSLYSAVTAAMSRLGWLEEWLDATARTGSPAVSFSSCFPYLDDVVFVVPPRTVWPPVASSTRAARVRWKSARFVPLTVVQSILAGQRLDENQWSVDGPSDCLVPAGKPGPFRTAVRSNAGVDRLTGASERHSTGCIEFRAGSGLWTVVSFADEAARETWSGKIKAAFRLLADSGFGGERSRGWGRSEAPEFTEGMLPDLILPLPTESAAAHEPVEGAEAAVIAPTPVAPLVVPAHDVLPSRDREGAVPEPEALAPESEPLMSDREGAVPLPDGSPETAPEPGVVMSATTVESPAVETVAAAVEPTNEAVPVAESTVAPPTAESPAAEAVTAAGVEPTSEAVPAAESAVAPPTAESPAAEAVTAAGVEPTSEAVPVAESAVAPPTAESPAVEAVTAAVEPASEAVPAVESVVAPPAAESPAVEAVTAAGIEPTSEAVPAAESAVPAPAAESPAVEAPAAESVVPAPAAEPQEVATAPQPAIEPETVETPAIEPAAVAEPEAPAAQPEPEPLVPVGAPTHPHWLLSLFTPAPADSVDWRRGNYTVLPRAGRVDSPAGSGELKKQIQMVAEGSVLYAETPPRGSAADVAPDGFAHPVFRAGFAVAIPLPEVR
jgi:CRISPR type III-A-associated RAMP protein Csm4